jgi:hypothetical protein
VELISVTPFYYNEIVKILKGLCVFPFVQFSLFICIASLRAIMCLELLSDMQCTHRQRSQRGSMKAQVL